MEQMPAGEIGFHRDAAGGPPMREAGESAGVGHHCSSAHRDLEAIVHQRLLLKNVALGGLTRSLTEPSPILVHPILAASPSRRFPVTVTQLPVTRCQICHRTVAYRPGSLSEVLTDHYRRAHPEALGLSSPFLLTPCDRRSIPGSAHSRLMRDQVLTGQS